MKISVVLPTYNESENIAQIIDAIHSYVKDAEILVVDDDSPDKTWKIVQDLKKKNARVIRRINERGLPSAVEAGIKAAKGDVIVWMDADFSHPPEIIPKIIEKLEYYDVVKGSRYVKSAKDNRGLLRRITSIMFNKYATFMLSPKVTDWDTQFVAAKKEVFEKVRIEKKVSHGQYLVKFLYDCIKNKFKVTEVPIIFNDRKKGASKTVAKWYSLLVHGWNYGMYVLKIRFEFK